jgi:hypothetical protein
LIEKLEEEDNIEWIRNTVIDNWKQIEGSIRDERKPKVRI